jgi:hypothetical protein
MLDTENRDFNALLKTSEARLEAEISEKTQLKAQINNSEKVGADLKR